VRVGAGEDGHDLLGAGVHGQVGDVGGDVDQVAGGRLHVVLEPVAPPHLAGAGDDVDRGFVGGVLVGLGAASGRDALEVHADGLRPDGLAGDAFEVGKALFSFVGLVCAYLAAILWHGHRWGLPA
jgi:hypothetical protein